MQGCKDYESFFSENSISVMMTPAALSPITEICKTAEEAPTKMMTNLRFFAHFTRVFNGLPIPSVVVPVLPNQADGLPAGVLLWGKPN